MFQKEWQRDASSSSDYFFRPHAPLPENNQPPATAFEEGPWKEFLHIPYESEPIEKSPDVLLLPVDPYRIWAGIRLYFPVLDRAGRPVHHPILKICDVTSSRQNGDRSPEARADYSFELETGSQTAWFIPLWSSGRVLHARLGHIADGHFSEFARSNEIRTPFGKVRKAVGRFRHFLPGNRPDPNTAFLPKGIPGMPGKPFTRQSSFSDSSRIGYSSSGSPKR
ncbi:MAG: DUF4912 domain-containing protein [Leptospirales bacterium]